MQCVQWPGGARFLTLALASLMSVSFAYAQADPHPGGVAPVIYIVRRGWHVDVGFAADDLAPPLDALEAGFPGVRYLIFGFGDRRYLMSKHRTPAMLGALWPGKGLILVTALAAGPAHAFGGAHVIALQVSPEQSAAAEKFIWDSLVNGVEVAPGPYEGSAYFNARADYSALHTCNTWVAEVLRNAGLPVRTRGVVFAGQIWTRARRLAAAGRSGGGTVQSGARAPAPRASSAHSPGQRGF